MLKLYDSRLSGNAYRVRLMLRRLGLEFERITFDLAKGEAKTPEFAAKSRFARVPTLEFENGRTLVESAAIILHLAEGTELLPDDPMERSDVVSWLFFEQADLMRYLAVPRFMTLTGRTEGKEAMLGVLRTMGGQGLDRLEGWLKDHDWLALGRVTLADYGVYPYVSVAHQGGYDMSAYPGIAAWLKRMEAQPGWEPLLPEGAA